MPELKEIGQVSKPHGLKGDLVVSIEQWAVDALLDAKMIYLNRMGSKVPYVVDSAYLIRENKVVLDLAGVSNRVEAEELKWATCFLPADELPEMEDDFSGFEIREDSGKCIGVVVDLVTSLLHVTLVLDTGAMIPLADDYIIERNDRERWIKMNLPDGLLDL